MLDTLHILSYLIFTNLWGRCFYYAYFRDEETEPQKGLVTWPRSYGWYTSEQRLEYGPTVTMCFDQYARLPPLGRQEEKGLLSTGGTDQNPLGVA